MGGFSENEIRELVENPPQMEREKSKKVINPGVEKKLVPELVESYSRKILRPEKRCQRVFVEAVEMSVRRRFLVAVNAKVVLNLLLVRSAGNEPSSST